MPVKTIHPLWTRPLATITAPDVLRVRHNLHVHRVDAGRIPTGMVYLKTRRYRPYRQLVKKTMGIDILAPKTKSPVAATRKKPWPFPTFSFHAYYANTWRYCFQHRYTADDWWRKAARRRARYRPRREPGEPTLRAPRSYQGAALCSSRNASGRTRPGVLAARRRANDVRASRRAEAEPFALLRATGERRRTPGRGLRL